MELRIAATFFLNLNDLNGILHRKQRCFTVSSFNHAQNKLADANTIFFLWNMFDYYFVPRLNMFWSHVNIEMCDTSQIQEILYSKLFGNKICSR